MFTHRKYRLSHLSQIRNLACLAIKWNLLVTDLMAPLPASPPHPVLPMPCHSPYLPPATPTSIDYGQLMVENQAGNSNWPIPFGGDPGENYLYDDEYVDFSVSSGTSDEEPDETDMDNSGDSSMNDGEDDSMSGDMNNNTNSGTSDSANGDAADHDNLEGSGGTGSGEGSQVKPTIVHFPGRCAGEVYSRGITTVQQYENALGGLSKNLHFPFASKTNWELAKWVKLRGPSATSFTELLNISGVSINPNCTVSLSYHICLAV